MELTYHRSGEYLYPNLTIESEGTERIGKYGMLRKTYLKEHHPNWYQSMLLSGKLEKHLAEIETSAQAQVERIVRQMIQRNPAPDKESNPLGWAAHLNSLTAAAEEIVLTNLVYA